MKNVLKLLKKGKKDVRQPMLHNSQSDSNYVDLNNNSKPDNKADEQVNIPHLDNINKNENGSASEKLSQVNDQATEAESSNNQLQSSARPKLNRNKTKHKKIIF